MIMENMAAKPADSKMDGDIVVRLRSCAAVEPSVRECLKAFPQWQAGEAKPAQPGQWQDAADALRTMRCRTLCAQIRLRTEQSLPLLVSPEQAEEFLQWLSEHGQKPDDIRHFLFDLEPCSVDSANTQNVMVFAAKVLSLFTKVPWLIFSGLLQATQLIMSHLSASKYIYIYIHIISNCLFTMGEYIYMYTYIYIFIHLYIRLFITSLVYVCIYLYIL